MSTPSTPSYNREELFNRLYTNIAGLKDTEEYSENVVERARDIESTVDEVEESFNELEEFSDTAQEYILWLEDLNAELGDQLEETDDPRDDSYIEDLLDQQIERLEGLLDEYVSDLPETTKTSFAGNYKSPTFNFGVQNPQSFGGNYKSPTFNLGSMPDWGSAGAGSSGRDSNILDSWDDYDWSGWEKVNDPGFEDPWEYAESMGIEGESSGSRWPSIEVKYHGGDDEAISFGGEAVESDPSWSHTSGTGFEDVHTGDYRWIGGGATAS